LLKKAEGKQQNTLTDHVVALLPQLRFMTPQQREAERQKKLASSPASSSSVSTSATTASTASASADGAKLQVQAGRGTPEGKGAMNHAEHEASDEAQASVKDEEMKQWTAIMSVLTRMNRAEAVITIFEMLKRKERDELQRLQRRAQKEHERDVKEISQRKAKAGPSGRDDGSIPLSTTWSSMPAPRSAGWTRPSTTSTKCLIAKSTRTTSRFPLCTAPA
jgi:hypothetical protein